MKEQIAIVLRYVIDRIGEEMKSQFGETSIELLICVASLDLRDSFSHFSKLYPQDILEGDLYDLKVELMLWIHEMRRNEKNVNLQSIGALA
ncbi:hypothetical protein V2J09_017152 [Rumex salicifolius]